VIEGSYFHRQPRTRRAGNPAGSAHSAERGRSPDANGPAEQRLRCPSLFARSPAQFVRDARFFLGIHLGRWRRQRVLRSRVRIPLGMTGPGSSDGRAHERRSRLFPGQHLFTAQPVLDCATTSTSAGGVGSGYFACKAGDAGSNPALSASSGRLVAQDASCSAPACSPAHFNRRRLFCCAQQPPWPVA